MSQELNADPKTHVVITHSQAHYHITSKQNDKLVHVGLDDLFVVDGNKIKGSSIAEVMTMQKYYETYPEKVPAPVTTYDSGPLSQLPDFRSEKLSQRGLLLMIKGIKISIAEFKQWGHQPNKAEALLKEAEDTYRRRYGKLEQEKKLVQ